MRFFILILTIAAFVARYRADYEACAADNTGHVYGQQCYQVFNDKAVPLEHAMAKQGCQARNGHLAVVIGGVLRQKLAEIVEMLGGSNALVALIQESGVGSAAPAPADNWFWSVDGELELATSDTVNKVEWHDGEPNDDWRAQQQFGAMVASDTKFIDAAEPFYYYICQFRKRVAKLRLYAKDTVMTVHGQNGGIVDGVSLEGCAVACYSNPGCMAVSYKAPHSVCALLLVRPQDLDADKFTLTSYSEGGVWVKE